MPKHSLVAIIGFANSTVAAVENALPQCLEKSVDPRIIAAEVKDLCAQVLATDGQVRNLLSQARTKAAELAKLKRQLYNKSSQLVDMGILVCGKKQPAGHEFSKLRSKLRRRRSPQRPDKRA
ncbi:MAG: hypothetical protein NT105_23925 [Verrucomicrobia bacterium]|nr:hypothetical protein [Verrucomicrobiota bacterium]